MARRIWIISANTEIDASVLQQAQANNCPEIVRGIPPSLTGILNEASLPIAYEESTSYPSEPPPPTGYGDMTRAIYDPDADGKIANAELASGTDISDAVQKKHNNAFDHSNALDHSNSLDHSHGNKSILDTYTQTEANLGDAVSKKHDAAHNHSGIYEPADSAIQTHIVSAHAPGNAQKNSDITKAEIEAKLTGEISSHTHAGGGLGYTLPVQALTSSPVDAQTVYFGNLPKAPTTTANISKIYIRKAGTIKIAEVYCYSGTAGTAEAWSLYIRKNNSADTLIATLSVSANERVFSNTGLSIAVAVGDYIEIKGIQPTWATNPLTTIYGGYVYVE